MSNSLNNYLEKKLNAIKKAGWSRQCTWQTPVNSVERIINNQKVINFCSNDYLGLAYHPEILQSITDAGKIYGTGSTGSPLITGGVNIINKLETEFAKFKNTESALYFNTGYMANIAILSTLLNSQDVIYTDEYNHASINAGAKLSGATIVTYKHLDLEDLETKIKNTRHLYKNSVLITDSVFSMDGDYIEYINYIKISEEYNLWLITDEAHSTGIWGDTGQGLISSQLPNYINNNTPIQIHTCSKALGLQGAIVTGSSNLINYLRQRASSYIYSTANSPVIIAGLLKSLEIIQKEPQRRSRLWANIYRVYNYLQENNYELISNKLSPILCIKYPDNNTVINISQKLLEKNIWIHGIRPPTVPSPRLRLTLSSEHTDEHLNKLFQALNEI